MATASLSAETVLSITNLDAALGASVQERARTRLRALLAEHAGCDGIEFDSRAWLITARRGQATGVPV